MIDAEILTAETAAEIRESVSRALAEAIRFAEESPLPDPSELTDDVYVD